MSLAAKLRTAKPHERSTSMIAKADREQIGSTLEVSEALRELRRRMQRPQRHRLLHGYPLAAAMPRVEPQSLARHRSLKYDPSRGLLVGVLPHPFCNPAVRGCGFCTFPHEAFSIRKASVVIDHVVREIGQRLQRDLSLVGRPVAGLYFGGGTANLSPPDSFRKLCRYLSDSFDLSAAEVTLEGIPAAFLNRQPLLVDILREELPARHFRLSMGIQTFDEDRLRQMGRQGFGYTGTFREVVRQGHARGFTVSGDLLFNLPGQSLEAMRDDVRQAVEIGIDHMGLYHLVMFAGLGTEWSRDPALVDSLPSNAIAAGNWLELREFLLNFGFNQTTLTNFEGREFLGSDRRFVYEELSFQPDRYDMIGFGPSAISAAGIRQTAVKVMNPESAAVYNAAIEHGGPQWDREFCYTPQDLRVFHLTRRLAALRIYRLDYQAFFGTDPVDDFPTEFEALGQERLVTITEEAIEPTELGMFYADSIASLLARKQVNTNRARRAQVNLPVDDFGREGENAYGHM
jgi:oxygen-independent coproporphyrinogen-3 oxidase